MIDTDLLKYKSDLEEVVDLFEGASETDIRHMFSQSDKKTVNTVVINGKAYAYGNYIGEVDDEIESKRLVKRYAKLSLYKALSAYYGEEKPWGALTGVRPTKLAYTEIEKESEFFDFFTEVMKVSEEKTELTALTIEGQKGIYEKKLGNGDFFVFIPFCPSRCKYCSFISADVKRSAKYVDAYVDALVEEIKACDGLIENLRSVYVGGGTPVALTDAQLEKVLSAISVVRKSNVEFTVEAGRPDALTESKIALLKKYGVTRVCVNPQTFNDKTLQRIGRSHTAEDVVRAYNVVKDDFSVNMDLIAGLDGESFEDFKYSVDCAVRLSPDAITIHTLCIKRGSTLSEETQRLAAGEIEKMVDYARETLLATGYGPYYLYRQKYMAGNLENVGYCKPGCACVYNIDVMEETTDVVACGANAISKRVDFANGKIERLAAPKDVPTYLEKQKTLINEKNILFSGKTLQKD